MDNNLQYPMNGDTLMLRFDGNEEDSANPDDVLARRLKNRERQRRYRARKREQEDNTRKALITATSHLLADGSLLHCHHQPTGGTFVPVPLQIDDSVGPDCSFRVRSMRNWKRDARKASEEAKQEPDGYGNLEAEENPAKRVQLSRRHWKSDARNKKGEEEGENQIC